MVERARPTPTGGIESGITAFPIGSKAGSDQAPYLASRLGDTIRGPKGTEYMLVRLNVAAGMVGTNADGQADPPGRRTMIFTDLTTYDVAPGTVATDQPAGVTPYNQVVVADNEFLWIQIDGITELYQGDDATDTTAGDFMSIDNDADKGKVVTVTTNFNFLTAPFKALETQAGNDKAIRAQIMRRLGR